MEKERTRALSDTLVCNLFACLAMVSANSRSQTNVENRPVIYQKTNYVFLPDEGWANLTEVNLKYFSAKEHLTVYLISIVPFYDDNYTFFKELCLCGAFSAFLHS